MALGSKVQALVFTLPGTITVQAGQIKFKNGGRGGTLCAISCNARAFGSGVTAFNCDIKNGTTAIAAGAGSTDTAGTVGYSEITAANRHFAAGDTIVLEPKATGGTQVSDGTIVLYVMWDG